MNDGEQSGAGGATSAEPPSTGNGGPQTGDRGENWLDRLRAVVGLKNGASFRADLEQALASEETAEAFSPEERAMLRSILRLRDIRVEDVMVPRADIEAVEIHTPLAMLLQDFRESGHSRMPVYCDTLDDPRGMVHIKDVMGYVVRSASKGDAEQTNSGAGTLDLTTVDLSRALAELDLVRNILFVPPSMPAASLLAKMQASRMQMALVIDEYGGTDGLVSLEDIVEIVVGEIEDEHDDNEGPMIVAEGEGMFLADGRADLEEVGAMIGQDFARAEGQEDVDTIGGLIFGLLGRIPVRGELVAGPGGYEFEILDADPRRIKRLRIRRRKPVRRPRTPADPSRTAGDAQGKSGA
jgi:CBS domain containing-hemolysin-like protein